MANIKNFLLGSVILVIGFSFLSSWFYFIVFGLFNNMVTAGSVFAFLAYLIGFLLCLFISIFIVIILVVIILMGFAVVFDV